MQPLAEAELGALFINGNNDSILISRSHSTHRDSVESVTIGNVQPVFPRINVLEGLLHEFHAVIGQDLFPTWRRDSEGGTRQL